MANVDAPRGLAPWNGTQGGPPRLRKYVAGTTTSIGRGDVVALATNGRVHRIATTTGSAAIVGVAANYIPTPGSSTADVWVYDDPQQIFTIQDDGASATPAQADVGATFPLILGTPNTLTGQSIQELDVSAPGTATTDPLLVLGFVTGGGLEVAKNATYLVKLNRHLYITRSAGI